MLESLHLKNVGPAPEMKLDLGPRLNLITGDNGLGKTLLLDAAWWALTRTWPGTWSGKGIVPEQEGATIAWSERRGEGTLSATAEYNFGKSRWPHRDSPTEPGGLSYDDEDDGEQRRLDGQLVIYLRVDGGISVHDPLRVGEDFRVPFGKSAWGTSSVFQFREGDIWDGLELDSGKTTRVCEGLVRDVSRWAVQPGNSDYEALAALVEQLAGLERFQLTRKVARVYVDDARDYPIVAGPAGELPVAHAPAGLRRILGLAYLIVWARREHRIAAGLKKRPPNRSLVLLMDEVESHLHPKWQRTVLPSLLRALGKEAELQVIATTHSPMVLASVESSFDDSEDAWFDLDLEQKQVVLRKRPYVRHGEVGNWLVSEAFDLKQPRSFEGEQAVDAAEALMRAEAKPSKASVEATDRVLRTAGLPDIDTFWVRWRYFRDQILEAAPEQTSKRPRRSPK